MLPCCLGNKNGKRIRETNRMRRSPNQSCKYPWPRCCPDLFMTRTVLVQSDISGSTGAKASAALMKSLTQGAHRASVLGLKVLGGLAFLKRCSCLGLRVRGPGWRPSSFGMRRKGVVRTSLRGNISPSAEVSPQATCSNPKAKPKTLNPKPPNPKPSTQTLNPKP